MTQPGFRSPDNGVMQHVAEVLPEGTDALVWLQISDLGCTAGTLGNLSGGVVPCQQVGRSLLDADNPAPGSRVAIAALAEYFPWAVTEVVESLNTSGYVYVGLQRLPELPAGSVGFVDDAPDDH